MKSVIIIDDEPLARSIIKDYLQEYTQFKIVQECNDGFEGIKAIKLHQPDLVFLDIQMPKINGFEMLELLEHPPTVIFTTAFDEYAIKAFETHAVDYLLKPFSNERFDKAIQKWLDNYNSMNVNTRQMMDANPLIPTQSERIVVKDGSKIKIIPIHEIDYLEAADDYVKIHIKNLYYLKNKTMSYFEQLLNNQQFVRSHRSYIINVHQITKLEPYEKDGHIAILCTGTKVPISKTGYAKLKEVLGL